MKKNKQTILVTGGAGFVGCHLCKALVDEGNAVIAVDNLSNGRISNIEELHISENFKFIEADVLDADQMRAIIQEHNFDMVYHLASNVYVRKGEDGCDTDVQQTLNTTLSILKLMAEFNIKKLFFASSSTIYGNLNEPISNDNCTIRPISYYGASKLACEAFISAFSNMNGIQVWIARFANVIGPKMTHGVIVDFVNKLKMNSNELLVLGDGLAKKPYVYVSDIINAIQKFVTESNTQYNTIVIGNNSVTEVYKIAEMVITAMGVDAVIKHTASSNSWKGDVKEYSCAPTIINGVEFKCLYNSDDAVKQTILDII